VQCIRVAKESAFDSDNRKPAVAQAIPQIEHPPVSVPTCVYSVLLQTLAGFFQTESQRRLFQQLTNSFLHQDLPKFRQNHADTSCNTGVSLFLGEPSHHASSSVSTKPWAFAIAIARRSNSSASGEPINCPVAACKRHRRLRDVYGSADFTQKPTIDQRDRTIGSRYGQFGQCGGSGDSSTAIMVCSFVAFIPESYQNLSRKRSGRLHSNRRPSKR
jgi:hypothetical protein